MTHPNPSLEPGSTATPSLHNAEDRLSSAVKPDLNAQLEDGAGGSAEGASATHRLETTTLRGAARPCILVVDDDSINSDLIESALETDYEVLFAKDGKSALKMAEERVPDLILLDVMMPGIDGYEVCRKLKAGVRTARVPVIFMTGLRDRPFVTAAVDLGAAGYVLKPVDARSVRARVDKEIRSKAA